MAIIDVTFQHGKLLHIYYTWFGYLSAYEQSSVKKTDFSLQCSIMIGPDNSTSSGDGVEDRVDAKGKIYGIIM